ncbi:MAG: glycosyltransferase family 4 protein [Gemmatimonadaceae bacterium]
MRTVAHFMPWPGIGGTEHATVRIAHAMREHAFRSVAFCRDDAPDVQSFFRDAGIETISYHHTELSKRNPMRYFRHVRWLARKLTALDVDLLHCADLDAGVEAAFAGRLARVPVLCHVRNPCTVMTRRDRLLLSAVSTFVFVSKDTWSTFALRIPPARGRVLYDGMVIDDEAAPGVGAEMRRELSLSESARVVGMTARVAPQKDYLTLGRAAVMVREAVPDVRFIIAGDNSGHAVHREHYAMVREELERLGVGDVFLFTGFRSDVTRLMRAFDVFVLSTHFEGLPLVVLEAMAMGLPVVATAVNGIPEVIDSEEVGLLAPHEDGAALARQLIALLTDPARANRIGAAGRNVVRGRFGMETFAQNVATLYSDALGDTR